MQTAETQVWSPTQASIDNEPSLSTLQGRMGDKRGILTLSEIVSEEPEEAIPFKDEAFVTAHIAHIKQKLLDGLTKLEHLLHKVTKGEAGLQTHGFRESVIAREGPDLEARLEPKMETPPREIVGNVHVLPAGRSVKAISKHLTKSCRGHLGAGYALTSRQAAGSVGSPRCAHC